MSRRIVSLFALLLLPCAVWAQAGRDQSVKVETPAGVGGPGAPLLTTVGSYNPAGSVSPNIGELAGIAAQETNLSILGASASSAGPRLPLFDPVLGGSVNAAHVSAAQSSFGSNGVNPLVYSNLGGNFGLQKGFATGAALNLGYTSLRQDGNWQRNDYNPYTNGTLGLSVTQPLLLGFGRAVNRRYIRIAGNNQRISDYVFRQQVIATVSSVIRLYWDLVSLNEDVRVKREALRLAEKLRENNRVQVEVGTLAPIEVKRAQAEVARSRQDLTNSESLLLQQELVIKKVLTRDGLNEQLIRAARVVPLDRIGIPPRDEIQPVQDLIAQASRNRPDLAGARLLIENSQTSLRGSRNALLPELDLVGSLQNNGFAGQVNGAPAGSGPVRTVDPFFLGGAGTLLSQIFARNLPNYAIGAQLTIPLRNRVAQADVVRDQLELRQAQVRLHNVEEQVRLEIESALITLSRARTSYDAALQTRQLQQEALEAERERYAVGASTSFFVIQYQRDLTQAQTTELIAKGNYAKARAALDRALGATLERNNVQIPEAERGQVSAPPTSLPQR